MGTTKLSFSDHNFEDNARDGMGMTGLFAIDIVPWYDYTERFVGISGQAENWPYYLMDNSHPWI
jgi:hypothetical protein